MSKKETKPKTKFNLEATLHQSLNTANKYSVALFVFLLIGIYGFLALRVVTLNQTEPDSAAVQEQLKTANSLNTPKYKEVAEKIKDLQDNSVSVQSLFSETRDNPFRE